MTVDKKETEILVQANQEGIRLVGLGGLRLKADKQVVRIPWADLGIEHVRFADFGTQIPVEKKDGRFLSHTDSCRSLTTEELEDMAERAATPDR